MKKNYFILGLFLPLIVAILCAGLAIVFVNMQQNLFDDNYKLFELEVNTKNQVTVIVLGNEHIVQLEDYEEVQRQINSVSRYFPYGFKYLSESYVFVQNQLYDILDEIIVVAE